MPQDRTASPVGAPLREAKQALRARVAAARDLLDPEWRAQASEACLRHHARVGAVRSRCGSGPVVTVGPITVGETFLHMCSTIGRPAAAADEDTQLGRE